MRSEAGKSIVRFRERFCDPRTKTDVDENDEEKKEHSGSVL